MHRIMPAMRSALLCVAAATIFVTITHGQSISGPPSEANHFIATPTGWVPANDLTPAALAGPGWRQISAQEAVAWQRAVTFGRP